MLPTFINLPPVIEKTISALLAKQTSPAWIKKAIILHKRYMTREKNKDTYLEYYTDALAYLALRSPATYTQIYTALANVKEVIPSFEPTTMLDIGSGSGVGMWAAQSLFPKLKEIMCIEKNKNVITVGKEIALAAKMPFITWKHQNILGSESTGQTYDIVLIANVLNELHVREREKLIGNAYNLCKKVLVIIEPGTPFGSSIVQSSAESLSHTGVLLAPYVNNSFVQNDAYWMHFSKRFIRPEFERRIRQHMRDNTLSASNFEETKFAYVAISKQKSENASWGRCVGPIRIQKGFLEVPILTAAHIAHIKMLQRNKKQYAFAKNLKWGQLIQNEADCIVNGNVYF